MVLPSIFAMNLVIEKQSVNEVMILGLNEPAIFDLKINNLGTSEDIMFYSFFSPDVYPKGTVHVMGRNSEDVALKIYPPEKINTGYYTFDYFIRNDDGEELSQKLMFNVIEFKDAFEIGSEEFDSESKTLKVYVHNKVNFNFENVSVDFSSSFFDFSKNFNLGPNQKNEFVVTLNKDDFKKLMAGYYTFEAKIKAKEVEADLEGTLKFTEKDILTTSKKTYGVIINTNLIEKTNEGNVITNTETVVRKNIVSRLFTSFDPEPNLVEREGFRVYYTWNSEIAPGDVAKITVKTNWTLPFVIVFLIVLILVIIKVYSRKDLVLRKKVSFVNAKGGEFALRVTLIAEARGPVERISIIDRLPLLTKVHEKFGGEMPSRIDEKNKRIEWNFEKLQAGEKRVLSYIVYSKIGILGKFALPSATAVYESEGEVKEVQSNQAFFMLEPRTKKDMTEE